MTSWEDTVMSRERRKELIVARSRQQHVPESQEDMLLTKQAQLSFEAGEQSKARLIADLQETVNRMLQDNSELVVKLEHERQEGRREVVEWVEDHSNQATISDGEYTYEARHPNQLFTDLGDWQEQKAKWLKEAQHG
jgi:hypothetical protein